MSSSASANRGQLIQVAEGILCSWLQEEGYTETAYHRLLNLLDAELLLDLPLKPGLKKIRSPAGLRFLWHIHAAKALGWKSWRPKGSARGFPASINTFLRQEWWPDVQASTTVTTRAGSAARSRIESVTRARIESGDGDRSADRDGASRGAEFEYVAGSSAGCDGSAGSDEPAGRPLS